MSTLSRRLNRLLLRLLSQRRGGSALAIRDLDYVREVLRFSAMFIALVIVPVVMLAALALRSLYTEEITIRAQLSSRAEAIANQVHRELRQTFDDFESEARRRAEEGDTSVDRLHEVLPPLRAIFRFDDDGNLAYPYRRPDGEDAWPTPSSAYEEAFRAAQRAETANDLVSALSQLDRAQLRATEPAHLAEVGLARARVQLHAGEPHAEDELITLAATYQSQRERHGVRVGDLAILLRGEAYLRAGQTDDAIQLLSSFVHSQLASPWTVGMPAEAFSTRQAMQLLSEHMSRRWYRIADNQLQVRLDRLYWATHVNDELQLVAAGPHVDGEFAYHPGERALWATFRSGTVLRVFSFDYAGLETHLARTVVHIANQVDPDLSVAIVSDDVATEGWILRHPLGRELRRSWVVVSPTDPVALAARLHGNRSQTRLVIVLAVLSAALGMVAALRMVNRELDNARIKADFAANVSHELRSPITQIRLKGEALQLDLVFDDADRQAHYDAIVREAERLSRLVDNVLDFASIERGQKRYTLRPGDIGDVLRRAAESVRAASDASSIEFVVNVPEDLPIVWLDRDALGQVVTNLLSNAVKYGAEGKWVRLSADALAHAVEFRVEDHGIGISPEDQDRIFEHFYRVQSADVRRRRGTGIGLTIVQYIVEAHNGTIRVESALGEGTTFVVSIPLTPPTDAGA
jgi:signal transduction histidine kinase